MKFRAAQATGFGRTDWVVFGPCDPCDLESGKDDCLYCDGTREVVVRMGMTEFTARKLAKERNA